MLACGAILPAWSFSDAIAASTRRASVGGDPSSSFGSLESPSTPLSLVLPQNSLRRCNAKVRESGHWGRASCVFHSPLAHRYGCAKSSYNPCGPFWNGWIAAAEPNCAIVCRTEYIAVCRMVRLQGWDVLARARETGSLQRKRSKTSRNPGPMSRRGQ